MFIYVHYKKQVDFDLVRVMMTDMLHIRCTSITNNCYKTRNKEMTFCFWVSKQILPLPFRDSVSITLLACRWLQVPSPTFYLPYLSVPIRMLKSREDKKRLLIIPERKTPVHLLPRKRPEYLNEQRRHSPQERLDFNFLNSIHAFQQKINRPMFFSYANETIKYSTSTCK